MRKTKSKRGVFWKDQMLPFVIVWTMSIGIIGIVSRLWQSIPLPFLYNEPEARVTLSLLTSVIGTGLAQVFLVERLLKKSMRGWMLYTLPSILVTLTVNRFLDTALWRIEINAYLYPYIGFWGYLLLSTLGLNAPTSLLQALWLRKRVKHAWLWPLLTIPLLLAFTAIPYGESNYQLLKLITLLSVGVIQAGLMHYLWSHPRDTEKAKVDAAAHHDAHANHLEQFERLERLQEREHETPLCDDSDHQTLQSKA
jgi:hypothetical protein